MSAIQRIKDYYPDYLKAHTHVWNRRLHVLGQLWTVSWLIGTLWLVFTQSLWFWPLVLLTPVVIYPIVWPAHRIIEKNVPATWHTPAWITKACDWIMLKDIIIGKLPS